LQGKAQAGAFLPPGHLWLVFMFFFSGNEIPFHLFQKEKRKKAQAGRNTTWDTRTKVSLLCLTGSEAFSSVKSHDLLAVPNKSRQVDTRHRQW